MEATGLENPLAKAFRDQLIFSLEPIRSFVARSPALIALLRDKVGVDADLLIRRARRLLYFG